MSQPITSLQNAKVKEVVKLAKRAYRDEKRRTVVEGGREVGLALAASLLPDQVFVCRALLDATSLTAAGQCASLAQRGLTSLYEVSAEAYAKMAYRGGSGGLLAVVPYFERTLDDFAATGARLALVVEGAEKPGNLGAVLRTADAAGADVVIACGAGTDLYNPNVVRASLGTLFTVPAFQTGADEAMTWLRKHDFRFICASPDADLAHFRVELPERSAIVVGSEAHGLTEVWLQAADLRVRIPMVGQVDSLNLSSSVAILLYEAVRQRHCA